MWYSFFMRAFLIGFGIALGIGAVAAVTFFVAPRFSLWPIAHTGADIAASAVERVKTKEELIAEALERSKDVRGLYMTAEVANDQGAGATRLRNRLIALATSTEINGMVIDVKEVCGPEYNEKNLKKLLDTLHANNIWAIARIVAFKDAGQIYAHPDWYVHRTAAKYFADSCANKKHLRAKAPEGTESATIFWQDNKGGYWLDPASDGARKYILGISKKMIDLGFDELQYDYVRFPSDGEVARAVYPAWDGKSPKYAVMKSFFEFLNQNLKSYKPDIILSADLFGYVAIRAGDVGIGQRLDDLGNNFDYISFMVYPSHYYSGLYLPADTERKLPELKFNFSQARLHPDVVVQRSLQVARDFLDGRLASISVADIVHGTSTIAIENNPIPRSRARIRPWLEDFFHDADKTAGRPFGIEKVRLQIEGAGHVEPHGWLLWNAANIYTEGALKKE